MAAKELSKDKIELLAKRAGISEKEVVEFYAEFIVINFKIRVCLYY